MAKAITGSPNTPTIFCKPLLSFFSKANKELTAISKTGTITGRNAMNTDEDAA